MKKSFVTIDCDSKSKNNLDYADLVSPAAVLNEKEVCNSLDFFSTKAPKKKSNLKKVTAVDELKNKRKRLEKYFSTIDLDGWSERNFVLPNTKSEDWHDDLHYIVLKQQRRSTLLHQLWLFVMLALFSIVLISIASMIYSKNGVLKHRDESNSYEFIQKFINDFNHTEAPRRSPNPADHYEIAKSEHESTDESSWLKNFASLIGRSENDTLSLTKKAAVDTTNERRTRFVSENKFKPVDESINQFHEVNYKLLADEASVVEEIGEKLEDSFETMAKNMNLNKLMNKVKNMF